MNLYIEKMNIKDLSNISEILFSDFDNFWSLSCFEEELKNTNSYFVIAKNLDNDEILGFAGIKIILDEADIMNIVVKKSYRHNGVATSLLKFLISYALDNNISNINLEVNENNIHAISLYNKCGFEKVGFRKKYYNGENDAIIMKKHL